MHESQTVRVADREDRIVDAEIRLSGRGQMWAGFLALVCIVAGIMLGMPVLALVGSFLPSLRRRRAGGGSAAGHGQ